MLDIGGDGLGLGMWAPCPMCKATTAWQCCPAEPPARVDPVDQSGRRPVVTRRLSDG